MNNHPLLKRSMLSLLLGIGKLSACISLSLACPDHSPCHVILDDESAQARPTPWHTNCLDSGRHALELRPANPAYTPIHTAWDAQPHMAYQINASPSLRTGRLGPPGSPPTSWHAGGSWNSTMGTTLDAFYGYNPYLETHTRLHLGPGISPPNALQASLLIHNKSHGVATELGWEQAYKQAIPHSSQRTGGNLFAAIELAYPWFPLALRQTTTLQAPRFELRNETGLAWPLRYGFPELTFFYDIPLRAAPRERQEYHLGPSLRLAAFPTRVWSGNLTLQSPGWPHRHGWQIEFQLLRSFLQHESYQERPASLPRQTQQAWLAHPRALDGIFSREALGAAYRPYLPRQEDWIAQMTTLAQDSGKSSPLCRPDEQLRSGLCLSSHCAEWILPQNAHKPHLLRGGIEGLPNSCLNDPQNLDWIPIEKIELGKFRKWQPLLNDQ